MKIPLNMDKNGPQSGREAQAKIIERDVLAAKKGDWNAKNSLYRTFMPLLTQLAQKRSPDVEKTNAYIEAGKAGLVKATRHYRPGVDADRFQILAANAIEAAMDHVDRKSRGFFSRLFGG
jgi:DNA-directed RNA polymerase specialized sigma subunit